MPRWNALTGEEVQQILDLYKNTEMTRQAIADKLGRSILTVHNCIKEHLTSEDIAELKKTRYRNSKLGDKNPMLGNCRDKHHAYKGVLASESLNGYCIILRPEWYSSRKRSRHVFLHHVVACEHLGLTAIPAGFQVHHCDGDRKNNDFSNLVVLTISAHTKLHWYLKRLEGATTISKESTLKWVEAHCPGGLWHPGDDIV